jgi:hypothetical protein
MVTDLVQSYTDVGCYMSLEVRFVDGHLDQCFSTTGPRPGTGPWHQLYRAAKRPLGICHFSVVSIFHE